MFKLPCVSLMIIYAYTAQKYHLRLFSDGLREYHLR